MSDALDTALRYHRLSKHQPRAYAPSPGFLDWETQPDPFRRFDGATLVPLPLVEGVGQRSYDALYQPPDGPEALSLQGLGLMFELALGLSAWKSTGPDRWALRNNPSSGNLHPTEGYLLLWRQAAPQLPPGLYHYAPHEHALEQRALLPAETAQALFEAHPDSFGALGLSSIIWREEWKYGERALRYCQHDVGHALAAARFAAAVQGWCLRVDLSMGDDTVAACLGLNRSEDFADAEPEHPDLIALLGGPDLADRCNFDWTAFAASLQQWQGRANRLSSERVHWPQIARVLPALHKGGDEVARGTRASLPVVADSRPPQDACTLIRRRRSAQRMDGVSAISRADFEQALQRTLPSDDRAPFDAFPYSTAVNLLLLVHAVEGLEPGLYTLIRDESTFENFRAVCSSALACEAVDNTPLPLYRLQAPLDLRKTASQIGCFQGIAGHSSFAVAMIADLGGVLVREGAWAYRRLYWEAGLIGQVLYLEAEASGLRGTGIGCYFDDELLRLLGMDPDGAWQALYQFTVGGPVTDKRLTTEPPYAHLQREGL